MQQAGATPAEAMAFTLSSAIQYADDCVAAGMSPDAFLPRFTFFFDISLSFFEEVAKFRAGRRIWARLTRERYGARDPRSWRFKFHAQTSGVDLTRQQPLNNIARVTAQAIAGIFGGLQSLHTDAYDEALSCPTQFGARIAVATQNILREEAHLTDVIDPFGGSYYVESLTNEMEARVVAIMADVERAGGMYRAVESGIVQRRIGESARAHQERIDTGAQTVVGVNAYQVDEDAERASGAGQARPCADGRASRRTSPRGSRAVRPAARRRRRSPTLARSAQAVTGAAPTSSAGRRGGRRRLHARRDLRHAAARAGLRQSAGRRVAAVASMHASHAGAQPQPRPISRSGSPGFAPVIAPRSRAPSPRSRMNCPRRWRCRPRSPSTSAARTWSASPARPAPASRR